jgi:hypothetical protein
MIAILSFFAANLWFVEPVVRRTFGSQRLCTAPTIEANTTSMVPEFPETPVMVIDLGSLVPPPCFSRYIPSCFLFFVFSHLRTYHLPGTKKNARKYPSIPILFL